MIKLVASVFAFTEKERANKRFAFSMKLFQT